MNSFLKIIPIFLLFCSCSNSSVQADGNPNTAPKLVLINIIGKDSINSNDLMDSVTDEIQYRWSTDMSINLTILELRESPAIKEPWFTDLGDSYVANQEKRLSWCKNYVDKHFTKVRANTVFSCILPPLHDSEGTKYVGGIAYVGGFGSEYAISVVQCSSTNLYACSLVINHEVGHVFNCNHLDSNEVGPNLMDKAAIRFSEEYAWRLPFHLKSRKVALQYLHNNKVKWKKGLLARCMWRESNGFPAARCWNRYKDKKFVPLLSP